MSDNVQPAIVPVQSPWRTILLDALAYSQQQLLMVCPYIKTEVVAAMKQALLAGVRQKAT